MKIRIAALTVAALMAVGGAAGSASASPEIDYAHVADLQEAHSLLVGMLGD